MEQQLSRQERRRIAQEAQRKQVQEDRLMQQTKREEQRTREREREQQQQEQRERERLQQEQRNRERYLERQRLQQIEREIQQQTPEQRQQKRERELELERQNQIRYDSEIDDSDTYSEGEYYNSDNYYGGGGSYEDYLRERRRNRIINDSEIDDSDTYSYEPNLRGHSPSRIRYDSEIDGSDTYSDEEEYYDSDEYHYLGDSYEEYLIKQRKEQSTKIVKTPKRIDPVLFKDMPDTLECGICMETINKKEYVIIPCNHHFCVSCLRNQLTKHHKWRCAFCRDDIYTLTFENCKTMEKING